MYLSFSRTARHTALLALVLGVGLSGCARLSESRVNPFNWFGNDRAETVQPLVEDGPVTVDGRPLVEDVTQLQVEAVAGGALVRAVGLPRTQGYYDAELVRLADPENPTVLTYEFRIIPPRNGAPAGTAPSREVIVAVFASDQALSQVRTIRVVGRDTARSVRR